MYMSPCPLQMISASTTHNSKVNLKHSCITCAPNLTLLSLQSQYALVQYEVVRASLATLVVREIGVCNLLWQARYLLCHC